MIQYVILGIVALIAKGCGGQKPTTPNQQSDSGQRPNSPNPTTKNPTVPNPNTDICKTGTAMEKSIYCKDPNPPPVRIEPPTKTYDDKVKEYNDRCNNRETGQAIINNIGNRDACGVGYYDYKANASQPYRSSYSLQTPSKEDENLLDDLNAQQQCLVNCMWTMDWSSDPKKPRMIQCSVQVTTDKDGNISSVKNTSDRSKNPTDGDPNYECQLRSQYRSSK